MDITKKILLPLVKKLITILLATSTLVCASGRLDPNDFPALAPSPKKIKAKRNTTSPSTSPEKDQNRPVSPMDVATPAIENDTISPVTPSSPPSANRELKFDLIFTPSPQPPVLVRYSDNPDYHCNIANPASINLPDSSGETLLNTLIKTGAPIEKIQDLIFARQANPFLQNLTKGDNALHTAIRYNRRDVVQKLYSIFPPLFQTTNKVNYSLLHIAVHERHLGMVEYLLNLVPKNDVSFYINYGDKDGDTPLHLATIFNYPGIVHLLCSHGADFNRLNAKGLSPVHECILHKKVEILDILTKSGANINLPTKDGKTPIMTGMANFHNLYISGQLCEDIRHLTKDQCILEYHAQDALEVISYLLSQNARIGASNNKNISAYELADDLILPEVCLEMLNGPLYPLKNSPYKYILKQSNDFYFDDSGNLMVYKIHPEESAIEQKN